MGWFHDQQIRNEWSKASSAEKARLEAEHPDILKGSLNRGAKLIAMQDQVDAAKAEKNARKREDEARKQQRKAARG